MEHERQRVLVVDDEDAVRKLVAAMLDAAGYSVVEAEDADRALAVADGDERVDVLVADVELRGLAGPDLAERLRSRWPDLRVLFVSGYTSDALEGRGSAFLQKPFTRAELTEAVRTLG
jgi:two-component system, cell cycle sensor histidine kinase and response regulator CckA